MNEAEALCRAGGVNQAKREFNKLLTHHWQPEPQYDVDPLSWAQHRGSEHMVQLIQDARRSASEMPPADHQAG